MDIWSLPLWLLLLVAFFVGLLIAWIYRRCLRNENAPLIAAQERDRQAAIDGARHEVQTMKATLIERDEELATMRTRLSQFEVGGAGAVVGAGAVALASGGEDHTDELRALRYKNWALETRLRRTVSQAVSGDRVTVLPTPGAIDVTTGEVSDAEELRGAKVQIAELQDRLDRVFIAAKTGQLSELARIEGEMSDGVGASFADTLEEGGATDVSALRYQNWLLARRLRGTATAARDGDPIDFSAIEADLTKADRIRTRIVPVLAPTEEDQPVAPVQQVASADDALRDENTGLRYRNWVLAKNVTRMVGASRSGEIPDYELIESDLLNAGVVAEPAVEGGTVVSRLSQLKFDIPPAVAVRGGDLSAVNAEAETLRQRVGVLEGELRDLRVSAPMGIVGESPADNGEVEALKYRVWLAQSELRRRQSAERQSVQSGIPVPRFLAAVDEMGSVRHRLSQAEAGLRQTRASLAASQTETQKVRAELAPAATASARLAYLEKEMAERGSLDASLRSARSEAATLRSRLWTAEWRLKSLRGDQAQLTERAQGFVTLQGEADSLRGERDAMSGEVRQLRERITTLETQATEMDALRTGRDEALGEVARLKGDVSALQAAAAAAVSTDVLDSERARAEDLSRRVVTLEGQVNALRSENETLRVRGSTPPPSGIAGQTRTESPYPVNVLEPELTSAPDIEQPVSGAESAALELIESGTFTASDANRPAGLLMSASEGPADDLKLINGIGPKLEGVMNDMGVYYFRQIAEFSPEEMAWLDTKLAFRGRIIRDRWTPQARYWANEKMRGALVIGQDGTWTEIEGSRDPVDDRSAEYGPPEGESVLPEPIGFDASDTQSTIDLPMSGAEAAALELIEDGTFAATEDNQPAGLLSSPSQGAPDDLKLIQGIGPKLEELLNQLGFFYFAQLGALNPMELAWLDTKLAFRGRTIRDRWLPQAQLWADRKADGALQIGPDGTWTTSWGSPGETDGAAIYQAPRAAAPEPRTVEVSGDLDPHAAEALSLLENPSIDLGNLPNPSGLLEVPRGGAADDLQQIKGVGPKLEAVLNDLGFYHFDQIAGLSPSDLAWLDHRLQFRGRTIRDGWVGQAQALLSGQSAAAAGSGSTVVDRIDQVMASTPPTPTEAAALRLIEGGYVADASNRPAGLLDAPSAGAPDDLKLIKGVGPKLEALLNDLGLYYYRQISALSPEDVAWVDSRLRFRGRIVRDRWLVQAATLDE